MPLSSCPDVDRRVSSLVPMAFRCDRNLLGPAEPPFSSRGIPGGIFPDRSALELQAVQICLHFVEGFDPLNSP